MENISVSFLLSKGEARDIVMAAFKRKRLNKQRILIAVISALIIADNIYAVATTSAVTTQNILFFAVGIFFLIYAFVISPNMVIKKYADAILQKQALLNITKDEISVDIEGEKVSLNTENIESIAAEKEYLHIEHIKDKEKFTLLLPKRIFDDEQLESVIRLLGGKDGIINE